MVDASSCSLLGGTDSVLVEEFAKVDPAVVSVSETPMEYDSSVCDSVFDCKVTSVN